MEDHKVKIHEQRLVVLAVLNAPRLDHLLLQDEWKCYLSLMLGSNGWNTSSIDQIFAWGHTGHNWQALWFEDLSDEEKLRTFVSDLSYFSDRMSLDRLFRLHHHYNAVQYRWQLNSESGKHIRSLFNS